MKFAYEVTINAPRDHVVRLFQDPDQLEHWQDGFVSKVLLSGKTGEEGAISTMTYSSGRKNLELTETILSNELPVSFSGLYEAKQMSNTMTTFFGDVGPGMTHFKTEIHYTRFSGILLKIISGLFPGIFKKQVKKWIDQFKTYAESSFQKNPQRK